MRASQCRSNVLQLSLIPFLICTPNVVLLGGEGRGQADFVAKENTMIPREVISELQELIRCCDDVSLMADAWTSRLTWLQQLSALQDIIFSRANALLLRGALSRIVDLATEPPNGCDTPFLDSAKPQDMVRSIVAIVIYTSDAYTIRHLHDPKQSHDMCEAAKAFDAELAQATERLKCFTKPILAYRCGNEEKLADTVLAPLSFSQSKSVVKRFGACQRAAGRAYSMWVVFASSFVDVSWCSCHPSEREVVLLRGTPLVCVFRVPRDALALDGPSGVCVLHEKCAEGSVSRLCILKSAMEGLAGIMENFCVDLKVTRFADPNEKEGLFLQDFVAAARWGQCVLLGGERGSGKTTLVFHAFLSCLMKIDEWCRGRYPDRWSRGRCPGQWSRGQCPCAVHFPQRERR